MIFKYYTSFGGGIYWQKKKSHADENVIECDKVCGLYDRNDCSEKTDCRRLTAELNRHARKSPNGRA